MTNWKYEFSSATFAFLVFLFNMISITSYNSAIKERILEKKSRIEDLERKIARIEELVIKRLDS